MKIEIQPFDSVGTIKFGMNRKDVRDILSAEVSSFRRNEDDEADTDEFESLGIYVEYDATDLCIAVELFSPAEPFFASMNLLGEPYATIRDRLKKMDSDIEIEDGGLVSMQLGIGMSADLPKRDRTSNAESVIAFSRGYYD